MHLFNKPTELCHGTAMPYIDQRPKHDCMSIEEATVSTMREMAVLTG
jgi:hypothetical protein